MEKVNLADLQNDEDQASKKIRLAIEAQLGGSLGLLGSFSGPFRV